MAAGPAPSEAVGDDANPEDASSAEVRRTTTAASAQKTHTKQSGTHSSMFEICFEHAMKVAADTVAIVRGQTAGSDDTGF